MPARFARRSGHSARFALLTRCWCLPSGLGFGCATPTPGSSTAQHAQTRRQAPSHRRSWLLAVFAVMAFSAVGCGYETVQTGSGGTHLHPSPATDSSTSADIGSTSAASAREARQSCSSPDSASPRRPSHDGSAQRSPTRHAYACTTAPVTVAATSSPTRMQRVIYTLCSRARTCPGRTSWPDTRSGARSS